MKTKICLHSGFTTTISILSLHHTSIFHHLYYWGLNYNDALLLASGAAIQTGLNPIDLNRLHMLQQLILRIVAMATNVILSTCFLSAYICNGFGSSFGGYSTKQKPRPLMRKRKAEETEFGRENSNRVVTDISQ